jgi:predicted ATP-grasp superfamily ATP-dependent carboligase
MPPKERARVVTSRFEVLVIGNYRQTLTVIRSLARANYRVIVGQSEPHVFTQHSRYVEGIWKHPDIVSHGEEFLQALSAFAQSRTAPFFIFPVGERELSVLAHNVPGPAPAAMIVMPDSATVLACLNKATFYELATRLGLPVAKFCLARSLPELMARAEAIGFPCVVKPLGSLTDFQDQKAVLLHQREELSRKLPSWPAGHASLIVQKFASGLRRNCHFLADQGELLAYFEQRVLRTDRSDYTGFGVDGDSVPPTTALKGHTARLIRELGYSGLGCVQFLVDEARGTTSLLELNPRLDATCAIPYYCGYDFPAMAVELAAYRSQIGSNRPANDSIYPLRRGVWTSGDLTRLGEDIKGQRVSWREAPGRLLQIARSFWLADFHLTWSWRDPLPTGYVFAGMFRTALRGILELAHVGKRQDRSQ